MLFDFSMETYVGEGLFQLIYYFIIPQRKLEFCRPPTSKHGIVAEPVRFWSAPTSGVKGAFTIAVFSFQYVSNMPSVLVILFSLYFSRIEKKKKIVFNKESCLRFLGLKYSLPFLGLGGPGARLQIPAPTPHSTTLLHTRI